MKPTKPTNFKGVCAICHDPHDLFSRYECNDRNLCRDCVVNKSPFMTRCPKCRVDERPTQEVLLAQMKLKTLPKSSKPQRNVACTGGCSRSYVTYGAMLMHRLMVPSCGLGAPQSIFVSSKMMDCCGRTVNFAEAFTHQATCDLRDIELQMMLLNNYGFDGVSFGETADEILSRTSPMRGIQWTVYEDETDDYWNVPIPVPSYNYVVSHQTTYEWDGQIVPDSKSDLYEWDGKLFECL